MSQLVKTKRQANFKDFKRFGAFKGLVEPKNVVFNSFVCKLGIFWHTCQKRPNLHTNSSNKPLIRCDQLKNKSSRRVTYGNPCYSIGSKANSIYFLNDRSVFKSSKKLSLLRLLNLASICIIAMSKISLNKRLK
jgi:hypothetical protein